MLAKDQSLDLSDMKAFDLKKADLKCDDFDSYKENAFNTMVFFNKETMAKEMIIEICKDVAKGTSIITKLWYVCISK